MRILSGLCRRVLAAASIYAQDASTPAQSGSTYPAPAERDGLLLQQPGVLIFAATHESPQHLEKIDDIGFGAGAACLH